MKITHVICVVIYLVACITTRIALSNESLTTATETRPLIFVGTVTAKNKIESINKYFDVWTVAVDVSSVIKDNASILKSKSPLTVYFDATAQKPETGRNAMWPLLKIGETYQFSLKTTKTKFSDSPVPYISSVKEISSIVVLCVTHTALADLQPDIKPETMKERSSLVFEGVVANQKLLNTEKIMVPNAEPVVISKYEALVKITSVVKGEVGKKQAEKHQIVVRFQTADDPRYKGERGPVLINGQKYAFFVEAFGTYELGSRFLIFKTKTMYRC